MLRRREWPADDAVGNRVTVLWQGRPFEAEIVGVVADVRHESLDRAPRPEVFFAHDQMPFGSMTFVIRAVGDPAAVINAAKREIWAVDPLQAFYETGVMEDLVDRSLVRQRFSLTVMTIFALLALTLCATGIYGIVAFTTGQRTREIGVRMALGADARAIRRMVLREGAVLIGTGLLCGVAVALVTTRFLRTLLFEVTPGDPMTIGGVCVLLASVGLAACYIPARRATLVDPLMALRSE
jgi:ABC-type antimicrobial peptide transport system permease subunit